MNDKKSDTQFVGKVHKILLDDSVRAGVRASAVAQDNKGAGIGVLPLQMILPYSCDVVADKPGRVVTDSQRHVAYIPGYIVDAVRNNLPVGEGGKVVVIGLWLTIGKGLSFSLEVPQHLLLLGVNANDGKSSHLRFFADGGDAPELFITVLDLLHRKVLIEGALPKAKGIKDLADKVAGDVVPHRGEFTHDLSYAQGDPHHILILREPRRMRLDDLHDGLRPLRMLGKHTLASSTCSADAAITGSLSREKFPNAILKSMCACSHNFANFAIAEPLSLEVGGLRGQEPSSVSLVQYGHIRQIAWREDLWRSFLSHFKGTGTTYKVKKISPVFLYYIFDNQQIKSKFYRFFGGSDRGGYSTVLSSMSWSQMAA